MRERIAALALVLAAAPLVLLAGKAVGADGAAAGDQGRAIFEGTCAACHGTDLAGGRGPSLFDSRLLARLGDEGLHQRISDGVPGTEMPAFAKTYSEGQIDSIVAYLHRRSAQLAPTAGPAQAPPAAPAPDPNGQRIHTARQDIRLVTVAEGLDTPWAVDFLPDGRALVTERTGQLRIVSADGKLLPQPVSGIPKVHTGQDAGLFDVAVSPRYAEDGWVYLAYSDDNPADPAPPPPEPGTPSYLVKRKPSMTVIVRGRIDARNRWTDQQDIFRAPWPLYTPSGMHYGCRLLFDGKGHLYFTLGERGDMANARRLDTPLGKVHRVNLDGSIPPDNPFAKQQGAVGSIWSIGHRNPEGLAIDPSTGLLWESEHGPVGGDEINIVQPSKDYGWGTVSKGIQPGIEEVSAPGLVDPVVWYFPTIAPSGIAFYEGDRYPEWKGSLFVTGLRGEQLRRLEIQGRKVRAQEIVFAQLGRVRDVTTGPDGLLYVLVQHPTGPGTGLDLSDPAPGALVRLDPITWKQEPFRRPQ